MASILDYPLSYRGLVLNGHQSAAGLYDKSKELDTFVVEQFDFSRLQIRDQREGLHLDTGGMLGPATKVFRYVSLQGAIRADRGPQLEDMIARLFAAFDVEEAQATEPFYRGAHPLDFYTPTDVAGYAPLVREVFLGRPSAFARAFERRSTGHTMAFGAELVCPDPRRYLYAITSLALSAGNGWSVSLPNWPAGMGTEVYPFVRVDMGAAGAVNFTLTAGTKQLVLDLTAQTADFTIDMSTGQIVQVTDGESRAYLRKSDVDSFLSVPAGGSVWTAGQVTGVNSVTVEYRQARS